MRSGARRRTGLPVIRDSLRKIHHECEPIARSLSREERKVRPKEVANFCLDGQLGRRCVEVDHGDDEVPSVKRLRGWDNYRFDTLVERRWIHCRCDDTEDRRRLGHWVVLAHDSAAGRSRTAARHARASGDVE